MSAACIDPFGAPEFFVNGVGYREVIGPDLIRVVFVASEQGESIVKAKLLIPISMVIVEHERLKLFLAGPTGGEMARKICGRAAI